MLFQNLDQLKKQQVDRAAQVLAASFGDSGFFRYVFPDSQVRARILPVIFKAITGLFTANGRAFATSKDVEALMLVRHSNDRFNWLSILKMIRMLRVLFIAPLSQTWQRSRSFQPIWQQTARFFKNYPPFVWLEMIAVDPASRGLGQMSRLMLPLLEYVDSIKTFCLLETENPANVAIYEHYGFHRVQEGLILAADIPYFYLAYDPQGILDNPFVLNAQNGYTYL